MATYKIFDAVTLRTFVTRRRKRNKSIHQVAANLHSVTYGPQPIVDLRNKIVLLWSAKAGSVFAIKWMFKHMGPVSYTHLRAHETPEHLVCRLLLEKKK